MESIRAHTTTQRKKRKLRTFEDVTITTEETYELPNSPLASSYETVYVRASYED